LTCEWKTWPPHVGVLGAGRWRDVVPETIVLVVGDDDRGVVPVGAVADGVDKRLEVILTSDQVGLAPRRRQHLSTC
jgi:hypothetical protein